MKVLCALIACLPLAAAADLELSPILADRMVLQAGTKAPIWEVLTVPTGNPREGRFTSGTPWN